MSVAVKICGIQDAEALATAVEAGAAYVGFVFFKKSRNFITSKTVAKLIDTVPRDIITTGLFVDPVDAEIKAVLADIPLQMLQLHGNETPQRVAAIKKMTGLPVMKALRLKTPEQMQAFQPFVPVVDRFLFDSRIGDEPSGGPINWTMLKGHNFGKPWMLAGGLTAQNVAEAINQSGAEAVDVSSGVEGADGRKNPAKIRVFIEAVGRI
jgi:phosphoribosylanthranilate isomerase